MKILVVTQHFYPERFSVTDICRGLVARGHEVTVLTGLPNYPDGVIPDEYKKGNRRQVIDGINVVRASLIPRGKSKAKLSLNYISFAVNATSAAKKLGGDFDFVLCYQTSPVLMAIPAAVYAKKHKIPFYLYCLDLWPDCLLTKKFKKSGLFYKAVGKISKKIYSKADKIFVSSPGFIPSLRLANPTAPIKTLYQFSDEKLSTVRKPDGTLRLLFAGNVGSSQSVQTIIYAAQRLRGLPVEITVAGDGSSLAECTALAARLGVKNVVFTGGLAREKMPELYNKADALLLTYAASELTELYFPAKLTSYLASGKPIIASCNGYSRTVTENGGFGLCCEAENSEAFAGLIKAALERPSLLEGCGERGRAFFEENLTDEKFFDILFD